MSKKIPYPADVDEKAATKALALHYLKLVQEYFDKAVQLLTTEKLDPTEKMAMSGRPHRKVR